MSNNYKKLEKGTVSGNRRNEINCISAKCKGILLHKVRDFLLIHNFSVSVYEVVTYFIVNTGLFLFLLLKHPLLGSFSIDI